MHPEIVILYNEKKNQYEELLLKHADHEAVLTLYQKSIEHFAENTKEMRAKYPDQLVSACMALAMMMVISMEIISPEHPIYVNSADKNASAHLWTALMILGKIIKDKSFDHHSILIHPNNQDFPETQLGWFTRFATGSLYETTFKRPFDCILIRKYFEQSSIEVEAQKETEHKENITKRNQEREKRDLERYNKQVFLIATETTATKEALDNLIELGADINAKTDLEGDTALILAAKSYNETGLCALLEAGADPFAVNKANQKAISFLRPKTALYKTLKGYELLYAVAFFNLTQVKSLQVMEQVNINFQNLEGSTALILTVMKNDFDIACELLTKKADPTITNLEGESAITLGKHSGMIFKKNAGPSPHYSLTQASI